MKISTAKALLLLLTLSTASQASELMDLSENYATGYLRHMSEHISDVNKSAELEMNIKVAVSELSRLQSKKNALQSEQDSAQSKKTQLKTKLQSLESEISSTQSRIAFLLSEFYPEFSSVSALSQGIEEQRNFLNGNIQIVQDEINNRAAPFQSRINLLTSENEQKNRQLSQLAAEKADYSKKLAAAQSERRELNQKIKELRERMSNSAKLDSEIASAQVEYEEAKKKKGDSKCILGGLFSSKCRAYSKAKDKLNDLKDIKSGKTLAAAQSDLDQEVLKIKDYQQKIERTISREEGILVDVKSNQHEISQLESRIARATDSLRLELVQRRTELNAFESSLGNAQRILSLESEESSLRSQRSSTYSQLASLERRMQELPTELSEISSQVSAQALKVSSAQAEDSFAKDQIKKLKEELLIQESDLKVALLQSSEVEVSTFQGNFPEEKIYASRDWSFAKSEGSIFDQGATTCVAKTQAKSAKGSVGQLSIGKVLQSHSQSEPTVFVKIKTGKFDEASTTAKLMTITLPTSSESFTMNLVPSLSTSDELIFMAQIQDRAKLIKIILAEYSVKGSLNHGEESFTFSLLGSTNTIKAASSSLAESCEGIDIID